MKNLIGKKRDINNPYAVFKTLDGAHTVKVLKAYQNPSKENKNPYAKWLIAANSPFSYGYDIGDNYIDSIFRNNYRLVSMDDLFRLHYGQTETSKMHSLIDEHLYIEGFDK